MHWAQEQRGQGGASLLEWLLAAQPVRCSMLIRCPVAVCARACACSVFIDVFQKFGVPITMEEARGPMGKHDCSREAGSAQSPLDSHSFSCVAALCRFFLRLCCSCFSVCQALTRRYTFAS